MKSNTLLWAAALAAATPMADAKTTTNTTHERGLITSGVVDLGEWKDAYTKAKSFVDALTTTEKYTLITGGSITNSSSGVNFTALQYKGGPGGIQQDFFVSAFSQASALGMTFDRDAIYRQSKAIADEFYGRGYQVPEGPTSEPLGRTVWGGRLGETSGPDPYHNGIFTGLTVKAYTDGGVIAGAKHFLLNEQETNRQDESSGGGGGGGSPPSGSPSSGTSKVRRDSSVAPYSSNADDKTIHEAYLWPIYDGVKAGMGSIMCAMNEVNGSASCEAEDLLMGLLKTE